MISLTLRWNGFLLIAVVLLSSFAVIRTHPAGEGRDSDASNTLSLDVMDEAADLDPINAEGLASADLERNKRKLPEAHFEAKNAVLGFVFGKIDNFLDTKTRVIDQLDRANVDKNRQWNIPSPVPINDVQSLITAVVSPKIRSIGNIANDLTTGVLTTITAFSSPNTPGANPNAGLGNVVSKFLSFSGPILQGSAGGGANAPAGGADVTPPAPGSDESGY